MKITKTNAMRALDSAKLTYQVHEYPHGKEAVDGIQTVSSIDYSGSVEDLVKNFAVKQTGDESTFRNIRFILRDPTNVIELYEKLMSDEYKDYNFRVVDPYTFYGLMAQQNAQ